MSDFHFPKSIPGDDFDQPDQGGGNTEGKAEGLLGTQHRPEEGYRSDPDAVAPEDLPLDFPKSIPEVEGARQKELRELTDNFEDPQRDTPITQLKNKLSGQGVEGVADTVSIRHFLEVSPFREDFRNLNFSGQDLRQVKAHGNFAGSIFDRARLSGGTIQAQGVDRADLRGTSWVGAEMTAMTIINADLRGVDLSEVRSARHLNLVGCDLRKAVLPRGEKAYGMKLENCQTQ